MTERGSIERRWFELRQVKTEDGLSLRAAAAEIGVTSEELAQIETTGKIDGLTEQQLSRAAAFYDVSVRFLSGG